LLLLWRDGKSGEKNHGQERLETVWLGCIEPIINALMRELTHMAFSLQRGCKSTAVEHGMKTLIKVYMTFP
jgi:hypothetical protein